MKTPDLDIGGRTERAKKALLNLNLGAFYLVCATISVIGNTQAAAGWLGWIWPMAMLAVMAVEFGGVVLSMHADSRRELGEKAIWTRVLSAVVALGAVLGATLGHLKNPGQAAFFGGVSALGYLIYLNHSGAKRRDALRARGDLPEPGPAFGLLQWLQHPIVTSKARALDRGTDDRIAKALAAVKTEHRNAKARSAAERLARKRMEKRFGKDQADLMLAIIPFDGVVERAQTGALERSGALVEQVLEWSTLPDAPIVVEAEIVEDAPYSAPADAPMDTPHSGGVERSGAECQVRAERSDVVERSESEWSGVERSNVVAIRSGAAEYDAQILIKKYGADVKAWPTQKVISADMDWGAGKANRAVRAAKNAA